MGRKWEHPKGWYPMPGEYLKIIRKADAQVAAGGKVRTFWSNSPLDAKGWQAEKVKALNGRINKKGGTGPTGRKATPIYQAALYRDQQAGKDFRLHRIVCPGSGLETEYGRKAYPDAHERFRNWRDA